MGLQWMLTALFLMLQTPQPEVMTIERQGEAIVQLNRSELVYPLPGIPMVDENKFDRLMNEIDERVAKAPVNATIDSAGAIVPGQFGFRLNRLLFAQSVYSFIYEGGAVKLEAPLLSIYPKVDSELISMIKEKQIGQYVTYYNQTNKNRSHNISLAAKAINNYVLFPGERFSFNEIVGIRTKERGYLRAPVIVRGEYDEDVGGGICQVSSTLFNAVDRGGLHIIERYTHSRKVRYVPSGRDATVSWYGPDFVFRNDYNQPILIRAYAYGGKVFISIRSSEAIHYKPREVPGASKELPEEIRTDLNVSEE